MEFEAMNGKVYSTFLLTLLLAWHFVIGAHFHPHHNTEMSAEEAPVCLCGQLHAPDQNAQPSVSQTPEDCLLCKLRLVATDHFSPSELLFAHNISIADTFLEPTRVQKVVRLYRPRGPPATFLFF